MSAVRDERSAVSARTKQFDNSALAVPGRRRSSASLSRSTWANGACRVVLLTERVVRRVTISTPHPLPRFCAAFALPPGIVDPIRRCVEPHVVSARPHSLSFTRLVHNYAVALMTVYSPGPADGGGILNAFAAMQRLPDSVLLTFFGMSPVRHAGTAFHLARQILPRTAALEHEDTPGEAARSDIRGCPPKGLLGGCGSSGSIVPHGALVNRG